MEKANEKASKAVELKRHFGLFPAVSLIISTMIGSGIFITPASALKYSGSIGMTLVVWTCCGITNLLGKICFYEVND